MKEEEIIAFLQEEENKRLKSEQMNKRIYKYLDCGVIIFGFIFIIMIISIIFLSKRIITIEEYLLMSFILFICIVDIIALIIRNQRKE